MKVIVEMRVIYCLLLILTSCVSGTKAVNADVITVPSGFDPNNPAAQSPSPFLRGSSASSAGSRSQLFYASTFFAGPSIINSIAFSPGSFTGTLSTSDVTIGLSTTQATETSSSTTFANNIGSDLTTVFNGALTLDPNSNPNSSFGYLINFTNPFTYDPSAGNLLIDVRVPTGASVANSGFFGSFNIGGVNTNNDGVFSIVDINADSLTGVFDTYGPAIQFNVTPAAVPEPSSVILFSLFSATSIAGYRRRRQKQMRDNEKAVM